MLVFQSSEIRRIQLRSIIERYGKQILSILVRCSSEEYTSRELIDLCAKAMRKKPKDKTLTIQLHIRNANHNIMLYPQDKEKAAVVLCSSTFTLNAFDVTFLNKFLIPVEQKNKNELIKIADMRNKLFHEVTQIDEHEFNRLYDELEQMLSLSLLEAQAIGNSHLNTVVKPEKKDEITQALAEIGQIDISNEMKKIRVAKIDQLLADAEEYLKIVGVDELVKYYDNQIIFNPIFFLLGKRERCHVLDLYTTPEFKSKDGKKDIELEQIVSEIEYSNENLLIEAPSGAGKTTLCRMLLARKKSGEKFGNTTIIPIDCRRSDIETLDQLIADIFPDATNDFSSEKLLRAVMSQIPLFFIDGLDESNEKSKKLVSEILSRVSKGSASFVTTSRPGEAVREFLNNLEKVNYQYIELTGIPEDNLEIIVRKYYDLFSKEKIAGELPILIKNVRNKILGRGGALSPLIICLITYLLVDKEDGSQTCQNTTDLYESIFQAMYRKLEKRLRDMSDYTFDIDDFEENLSNFENNLFQFSLTSLTSKQTFYSLPEININVNDKKFKKEALSAIFVSRTQFTRHGIAKKMEYSFPHRSFQEFLAAKQVAKIVDTNPDKELCEIIDRKYVEDERIRFFILGLLAESQTLSQEISDEIISFWTARSLDLTLLNIIKEGYEAEEVIESISKLIRRLEIEGDYRLFNLVLEMECPKLKRVDVKMQSNDSEAIMTMAYLKDKDVEISQVFQTLQEDSEVLLREICDGKCRIREFEGRLGESGLKLLPKSMNELTLWIRTGEEIQAVEWLSEATMHPKYQKESFQAQRLDIRRIVLIIEDECEVSSLPKKLPSASYKVDIRLPSKTYGNWQRVFDVIGWLKTVERKFPYTRVWFILPETNDFDLLIRLHEFVKVSESFPTSVYYHSSSYLTDNEGEAIQLDANCFEANPHIDELPEKIVQLTVQLRKSEQLKELQILRERLQGGNERVKPMQVLKLVIEVFDSCEATDDLNLLEGFPLSSRHLVTRFKSDNEESYQRDLDIDWIHKFVKKLPKNEWCHINIGNYNFSFEFWKSFIEILYKESLNVIVWNKFKDIPEDDLYALWEKFAGNTILRKTPTLPMPM